MFLGEKKEKERSAKGKPASNSSSETSDRKPECIENRKSVRRRDPSAKRGTRPDSATMSFKATRKKEDLGGGGTCGPFLTSFLNSRRAEYHRVPSSDSSRGSLRRRDGNKTDSAGGNDDDDETSDRVRGPKDSVAVAVAVAVRETKASRLRAAIRSSTSDVGPQTPKFSRDSKKSDKEKISPSSSPSHNSFKKKEIDKSYSRKSHLNRSHTSEGVYDDAYVPGSCNIRRRRMNNSNPESSPLKSDDRSTSVSYAALMENSNDNMKEFNNKPEEQSPRTTRNTSRRPLTSYADKNSSKQTLNGTTFKKHGEDKKLDTDSHLQNYIQNNNKSQLKAPGRFSSENGSASLLKSSTSIESFSTRKFSADKSKPIDVAARAEILAASTLKMINRLDEINNKTKKTQGDACKTNPEDSSRRVLPCNSVINSNFKSTIANEYNSVIRTSETKAVPHSEDKSSSSPLNRKSIRSRVDSHAKSSFGNSNSDSERKTIYQETVKKENKIKASDTMSKPSILKNKPIGSVSPSTDSQKSKPVSILKRKSLSQDEAQSNSPPVTFSPSALKKKENYPKRQGILKKRRSLDENEVLRRRSYSPDAPNFSDCKSILKNQRRSSMEELTRRSHSPDSAPQGILKRKSSKEEEAEDSFGISAEPQGILKRKSMPCLNSSQQHVKIAESVILSTAIGIGDIQVSENVRPILKKKSSSEEQSASDLSLTEVPKSILKKKTSLDVDEADEKPKKPILKSSRMTSSMEEPEDAKRLKNLIFTSSEQECVKPILKRENSKTKLLEQNGGSENEIILRRVKAKRQDRSYSSSDIDSELSAIFLKRRSLEFQPVSAINFDFGTLKTQQNCSGNNKRRGDTIRRQLSVAEKVNNLENFLEAERLEREKRNSPLASPQKLKSSSETSCFGFSVADAVLDTVLDELQQISTFKARKGGKSTNLNDLPCRSSAMLDPTENRKNVPQENLTDEENGKISLFGKTSQVSTKQYDTLKDNLECSSDSKSPSFIKTKNFSSDNLFDLGREAIANRLQPETSLHSTETQRVFSGDPEDTSVNECDLNCYLSVDSCQEKISSLCLKEASLGTTMADRDKNDDQDLFLLQKSRSVSAKASLFKELEKKSKTVAEEEKIKRIPKGNNTAVRRRHERKSLEANPQRFYTQPVSSEEVEQAVRKSRSSIDDINDDAENHEDELSAMSYKDRLRLFESTFSLLTPDPVFKKRGTRFRTQPVTSIEVENAQNQRKSSLASSQDEQPDPETRELGFSSAASTKENVLKSTKSKVEEEKSKPKGILKNLSRAEDVQNSYKKSDSDSDSFENEKKSILKDDAYESFGNAKNFVKKTEKELNSEPKGILKQSSIQKKFYSSEESSHTESPCLLKTKTSLKNLAAILQNVEPLKFDKLRKEGDSVMEISSYRAKSGHKQVPNPGITRGINKSRNNSGIVVKSQSHSSVSSAYGRPFATEERKEPYGELDLTDSRRGSGRGEPSCGNEDEPDESSSRLPGLRRSTTQPFTPSSDGSTDDDMSGASIRERLARLKRSGELDWQKRKSQVIINVEDELSVITAGNYLFNENCLLRDKNNSTSRAAEEEEVRNSSSILADRLDKLDAAKDGWKKRIKPSDAVKFSVEGKMLEKMESFSPPNSSALQISPARTPLAERKKRSPKAARFRSKHYNPSLSSVPSSPMEKTTNPISRCVSAPGSGKDGLFSLLSSEDSKETNGPVVTVPKNDDETFTSFFNEVCPERIFQERLEIKDEDLDLVTGMKSSQLLVQKRNVKTQRRRTTVKNPVKSLAARLELQEYTEIKTGIAEKELKRMKIEKASRNSSLAIEALAGLASQEDFTAVSLKKATEGSASYPDAPYKDLMLMQVKGRRHVQTRLVEPVAETINSGDCFILVTPNRVFHYVGDLANVIEKSRGAEISLHVQQTGDLGCTADSVITIGEGGKATSQQIHEFWSLLKGNPNSACEAGNVDEDELFESAIVDTNMVYEVINDELVPNETFWGTIPKIEVLDPNKILVFDFGSEFYVWNGKNVNLAKRRVAVKLAKELWEEGYDYTECDVCPLTAASFLGNRETPYEIPDSVKAGPIRPSWALFAKITQNMETVLFREKFLDWPDYSRVIRKSKKDEEHDQYESSGTIDLKPCDAKKMLENTLQESDLVLEGNHLGRGIRYFDEETRRCSEITTRDVTVWHINEYEYSEIGCGSVGQFHMEDSYVVRWHYVITITGRELSGQPSKHLTTGRDRYAYFCWQGNDSPINDKGAAACLTVELDKEHGPQVRVVQGFEPPAFLNLFRGKMVVHSGRRCSEIPRNKWRFFICRGEIETESALFEVSCSMRQLRSVASFLLVNKETGIIIVWHGRKSLEHAREIALLVARRIQNEPPNDFEFCVKEISIREETEGNESQDFIKALGGDNRQLYYSLPNDDNGEVKTPRLFHLTSVSGEFLFTEISSSHLSKDFQTPFPFLQSDLYSASQPALFLLDTGFCLWLWQGWREGNSDRDRGSGSIRFQSERRAAMSTALSYWTLKYGNSSPKAYLIWAGLEPLIFTNQFPFWTDRDDVAEINMKDGKKAGEIVPVKAELASLTQSTYPLAQLQNRPLPDGVNPTSLEDYLESQCFPELFGVEKEEFFKMPSWKKKKLKQEAGLF